MANQLINGINYSLDDTNHVVSVVALDSGKYTGAITIPSGITYNSANYSVTSVGKSAFQNCPDLTSITIPDSVTSIGYGAFANCTDLTSITIPDSATSIGNFAFVGCTKLTSVTIGNSVISIGNTAFQNCTSLTSITIPDSVTSIGVSAFYRCTGLTSVTIGNSVISIGNSAFANCTGLTSIKIPNSVKTIGDVAFNGCSSLTSVTIPNSVTSIGYSAFNDCTGLTSIIIRTVNLTNTSLNSPAFANVNGTFYVPLDSYKSFNAFNGKNLIVVPRTTYKNNTLLQWEGNSIDYEMNFDYYIKCLFTNTETGDIYLFGKKINND